MKRDKKFSLGTTRQEQRAGKTIEFIDDRWEIRNILPSRTSQRRVLVVAGAAYYISEAESKAAWYHVFWCWKYPQKNWERRGGKPCVSSSLSTQHQIWICQMTQRTIDVVLLILVSPQRKCAPAFDANNWRTLQLMKHGKGILMMISHKFTSPVQQLTRDVCVRKWMFIIR